MLSFIQDAKRPWKDVLQNSVGQSKKDFGGGCGMEYGLVITPTLALCSWLFKRSSASHREMSQWSLKVTQLVSNWAVIRHQMSCKSKAAQLSSQLTLDCWSFSCIPSVFKEHLDPWHKLNKQARARVTRLQGPRDMAKESRCVVFNNKLLFCMLTSSCVCGLYMFNSWYSSPFRFRAATHQ